MTFPATQRSRSTAWQPPPMNGARRGSAVSLSPGFRFYLHRTGSTACRKTFLQNLPICKIEEVARICSGGRLWTLWLSSVR